jgi:hypothetical protein
MLKNKIKSGNLYLYTMDPNVDTLGQYKNLPVIAIKENSHLRSLSNYPTWLCLMPNKTLGGFYPNEMLNISIEEK